MRRSSGGLLLALACTSTWLSSSAAKSSSAIFTVDTSELPRWGWNTKHTLDQVSCSLASACGRNGRERGGTHGRKEAGER